jgi:hypothetical protein
MSFFNKIKKGLGFGTLEVHLYVPTPIAGNSGQLKGVLNLTAKSDQQINEVLVKFEKIVHWDETKHRRASNGSVTSYTSHESQTFELGNYSDKTPFEMKAGEDKTIHFTIPFQTIDTQSPAAAEIEEGGVLAVLGINRKYGSDMRNVHSDYKVEGKVDLKGVAFDPKDSARINVT